jgi:hypothetical protein
MFPAKVALELFPKAQRFWLSFSQKLTLSGFG